MTKVWITADELAGKKVRFVDTRFSLQESKAGPDMYNEAHLSNAIYLDLEKDLSDMTLSYGRHPLPEKEKIKDLLERNGFQHSDQIVIYDQGGMPFAPRAYFIFKYAGFKDVFILKEGFEQLVSLGFDISKDYPTIERSSLELDWNDDILSVRETVKSVSDGLEDGVLLDARSPERYRGLHEPIDSVAGHIPGARNFDWEQLKDQSAFKDCSEVEKMLQDVVKKEEEITVYCGSGVTAAPLYAMLEEAGYPKVKLYVGSYSDWINEYPVEKK